MTTQNPIRPSWNSCAILIAFCLTTVVPALWAAPNPAVPAIIQKGFALYASGGTAPAFGTWRQGGLLERDNLVSERAERFNTMANLLGNYRGYDLVDAKEIGKSSRILYLSIHFDRGAMYARFLVYRAEKDWVVQNMDFNTRPEAIMPWLALEEGK